MMRDIFPSHQNTPSYFWVRLCESLWRVLRSFWIVVVLGLGTNILATRLTSPGDFPTGTPVGWLLAHSVLTLPLGIALLLLTLGAWAISRRLAAQTNLVHTLTSEERAKVVRTLQKEYRRLSVQSLQGIPEIVLGLHERADAVRSSTELLLRRPNISLNKPLPSGPSIVQAYDDAGQGLLLLGAPGAGKTRLLSGLACEMLLRAENDPAAPLPVVLNLSSWGNKKLPLSIWLRNEVQRVYGIHTRLVQALHNQEQCLLLLDGLDEVDPAARDHCVEAINTYRTTEHALPPIVCSRSQEYLDGRSRLALSSALEVQPLSEQEVNMYLRRAGKPMAGVRAALRTDPVLRQLLTKPLWLSLVIRTYQGEALKNLPTSGSREEQERQIWACYEQECLQKRRGSRSGFKPEQTKLWCIWLAKQMHQRHLTEFFVESLQPSWLMTKREQIMYQLFFSFVVGLPIGLLSGLLVGYTVNYLVGLRQALLSGLAAGLLFGLLFGLLISLPAEQSKQEHWEQIHPVELLRWSWKHFWEWLFIGLAVWLLFGLIFELTVWLLFGSFFSLLFGLPAGVSGERKSSELRTRPNQGVLNSGQNALYFGLFFGLLFWLFIWIIVWLFGDQISGLPAGLLGALLGILFVGLIVWLIRGLPGGLLGVLLGGVLFGLAGIPESSGLLDGLITGLLFGLLFGLLVSLPLGGEAYLRHYLLRFFLWRSGAMPWHYIRFLEDAQQSLLLQRVGGSGYRFIHPLFQEYFVSLGARFSTADEIG